MKGNHSPVEKVREVTKGQNIWGPCRPGKDCYFKRNGATVGGNRGRHNMTYSLKTYLEAVIKIDWRMIQAEAGKLFRRILS